MNINYLDILSFIKEHGYTNQREIAKMMNCSLGGVNKALQSLIKAQLLSSEGILSQKAETMFQQAKPKRAVILAAGLGMRMVPVNIDLPKALVKVKEEVLIERIIKHLHEVGIHEIYVVIGFMKEKFDYLIDQFNVKLIVNSHYSTRNNLYSLSLATKYLENAYIVPCDLYCIENPFNQYETYSWYMVADELVDRYPVTVNKSRDIYKKHNLTKGNRMVGIAYVGNDCYEKIQTQINKMIQNPFYEQAFWEDVLFDKDKMLFKARIVPQDYYIEINTYEQLREFDQQSQSLSNQTIHIIEETLRVDKTSIKNIQLLKKGMTNRSFIFEYNNQKYIMRIPGEGTQKLISRNQEYQVYQTLKGKNITDDILYMNPTNGYKITRFMENAQNCNPECEEDLVMCMKKLKSFHDAHYQVDFTFDLYERLEYYESLWQGTSAYIDYNEVKQHVYELKDFIEGIAKQWGLTHIDAVCDNFLFYNDEHGNRDVRLIDWEYAAMQDPHVDIAMFCIYALYEKEQVDHLIDIYFNDNCDEETRIKIYAYISICGLLWSNWCEYKRFLGVEFGEYSLKQYRYAKDYYRYVRNYLQGGNNSEK